MKIFLDFDDTLMHRTRMTNDIYAAFGDLSVDALQKHYRDFREKHPFTISGFTDYLLERGIDGARLRDLFFSFAHRAREYVFADAAEFVEHLKTDGHRCHLLSFDVEPELWQHPKIAASGLAPLFDEVHVTRQPKVDLLNSWNITEPFIFIDDKQSEIDAMQAAFPQALCIKHEPGSPLRDHLEAINTFVRKHSTL